MDKCTTAAEVVAELRDGMTIGIGGWGSRRKPMALVREILRSPLRDLTVVTYGGPDAGLLCKLGKVKRLIPELTVMESETKVRVMEVTLADGTDFVVPRANVEIIEE